MLLRVFLASVLLMSGGVDAEPRTDDPLEFINRPLFLVNDVLDRSVLKPIARATIMRCRSPQRQACPTSFPTFWM